jgi:L-malate glycosyltransferase
MRILHVVSSLNVGGAERFVIDLARQQKLDPTVEVGIFSMGQSDEPLAPELKEANISLHLGAKIGEIRSAIKQYDLIHIHSSHALARFLLASLGTDAKLVYTRHNERVHSSLKWQLIYFIARRLLQRMVFVAEKARQNYLKVYTSAEKKCVTVLNGVLPIKGPKTTSNKIRLGHVGRFVPLKAQHLLVEATAKLPQPLQDRVSINFYGTGELLETVRRLANDIIPNVEVNFHGFVSDRELIYNNVDVLVVSSETEGLSLAILEAMAAKTPIVATDVGGNPELVKPRRNGYLYDFGDSQSLANHLKTLIDDKQLIENLGHASHSIYNERFSMEICSREYSKVYSSS